MYGAVWLGCISKNEGKLQAIVTILAEVDRQSILSMEFDYILLGL